MPSGTLTAARPSADRKAISAAAKPAKWKWATVSDSTVRLKPNNSYDERSATSASAAIDGVASAVYNATCLASNDLRCRKCRAASAISTTVPAK